MELFFFSSKSQEINRTKHEMSERTSEIYKIKENEEKNRQEKRTYN